MLKIDHFCLSVMLLILICFSLSMSYSCQCSIMNLFGVLKYKKMGEDFVRSSGLPYTIIRFAIINNFELVPANVQIVVHLAFSFNKLKL